MKDERDQSFHYTPSYMTDVSKTFERVRRRLRKESERASPVPAVPVNIASLAKKKAAGSG